MPGRFTHLNVFNLKGTKAQIPYGLIHGQLLNKKGDKFQPYIAKSYEVNGKTIIFTINSDAYFSDGNTITTKDVITSIQIAKKSELIYYKNMANPITGIVKGIGNTVLISFKGREIEALTALSQLPIISYKCSENISTNDIVTSGPYKVTRVLAQNRIDLLKNKNWWGSKIPHFKNLFRIKKINFIFFKNTQTKRSSLYSGETNFMIESSSKHWVGGYNKEDLKRYHLKKITIPCIKQPLTMGFGFNLRKKKFQDIRMRKALTILFDFDTINRLFFHNLYYQSQSYFNDAPFSAKGTKPSIAEIQILKNAGHQSTWPGFSKVFGKINKLSRRKRVSKALELLKEAGWQQKNGIMQRKGVPLTITFITTKRSYQRIFSVWRDDLKKIGVELIIKFMDNACHQECLEHSNFDMFELFINHPTKLGNEQKEHWVTNSKTKSPLALNNPKVTRIILKLETAKTDKELTLISRALDRTLLWTFAMIPGWHTKYTRIIAPDSLSIPKNKEGLSLYEICTYGFFK